MPYKIQGKCIYHKNSDGSTGEKVGCTKGDVHAYMKALYAADNESIQEVQNKVSIKTQPIYNNMRTIKPSIRPALTVNIAKMKRIVESEVKNALSMQTVNNEQEEVQDKQLPVAKLDLPLLIKLFAIVKETTTPLEIKEIIAGIIRLARGGQTITVDMLPQIVPSRRQEEPPADKPAPNIPSVPVKK